MPPSSRKLRSFRQVLEGGETQDFKLLFDHFDPPVKPMDFSGAGGGAAGGRRVARVEQRDVDVGALHSQAPRDEAMSAMLDVSKSSVDVWRIGATQHRFGHSNPACVRPVDRSKGRIKGSDDPFVLPLILDWTFEC